MTRREALLLPFAAGIAAAAEVSPITRVAAAEANQGVAAGPGHLYAIANHSIGKYEKRTGKRVAAWECERGKPLIHLNSGVVRSGLLYCAHSNYPAEPMLSSIEIWDTATLRHRRSHSFGIDTGSATWIDFRGGYVYVCFVRYGARNVESALVQFDTAWRRRQAWVYPPELIERQGKYSISGGVFLPDGRLLCTGHDHPELYVLRFPEGGSVLRLEDTIAAPIHGQGIARDPVDRALVYGIERSSREIVSFRLRLS